MSEAKSYDLGKGTRGDLIRIGEQIDDCIENALGWTKELLYIRNRLGQLVALAPNDAQRKYADESWKKRKNIILKARQMGISTWIAGQFLLRTITHPGTVTVQVAHTQEAAEQIFHIVHRFMANLPETLREGALKSARVSARRVVIPELDSEYLVETAGDRNAGRGMTITQLHCTELARWPGDPEETLCGLMATLSPAGTLVMESTPNGAWGCFWKEWQNAKKTNTVQHFFPWWMEPAYKGEPAAAETLNERECLLMEKHHLSLEQIGYRRQILENFRMLARQEYAEDSDECFFASGSCYFDAETIDRRLPELPEPYERRKRGNVHIWFPPLPGKNYLVAVDPAGGGTAGDYTAMQVVEMEEAWQCAELQAYLSPSEAAQEAAKLAREYNGAMVAVERNSMGLTVLTCLENNQQYKNLWRDKDSMDGFRTTTSSRDRILSRLYSFLDEERHKLRSERLLRECRSFVRLENGRAEAKAGEHDDLVLAMAIALEARNQQLDRGLVH